MTAIKNNHPSPWTMEEVVEVLEPFADQAETFDSYGVEFIPDQFEPAIVGHTIGDLRRARALLSKIKEQS